MTAYLWNTRDLTPPSFFTYACKMKHNKADIEQLSTIISETLKYFNSLTTYETTAAYLSRFVFVYRRKFRNTHGFRLMDRANQASIRYKNVDIVRILENFSCFLPEAAFIPNEVHLPNRQNLEYILVRFQGLAKLFCRIVVLAKESAKYFMKSLSKCHYFEMNGMFISLMAATWKMSIDICKNVVHFYQQLLPLRLKLKSSKTEWLPEDYEFPNDLSSWLGDDWNEEINIEDCDGKKLVIPKIDTLFGLVGNDARPKDAEKVEPKAKKIKIEEKTEGPNLKFEAQTARLKVFAKTQSEVGEVVARKETLKRSYEFVRSKFDVKKFIGEERLLRMTKSPLLLTKNVPNGYFASFAKTLNKVESKMTTVEYVNFFKKEFKLLRTMQFDD